MDKQDDIKYTDRFVAFVDILGFRQMISSESCDDVKNISLFDHNIRHVVGVLTSEYGKIFSIKMFSDCLCLSCENDPDKFEYILTELSFIQLFFSTNGIFVRGGFSRGLHFENEYIIYSQGLVQAYELEKTAVFPRILLGREVVDLIKKEGINERSSGKYDYVMRSPDGLYFLDYLDFLYTDGIDEEEFLYLHKQSIIDQIHVNGSDLKVLEKYRWLSLYHNVKFAELFDENDYYEDAYREMKERLCIDMKTQFPFFEK